MAHQRIEFSEVVRILPSKLFRSPLVGRRDQQETSRLQDPLDLREKPLVDVARQVLVRVAGGERVRVAAQEKLARAYLIEEPRERRARHAVDGASEIERTSRRVHRPFAVNHAIPWAFSPRT